MKTIEYKVGDVVRSVSGRDEGKLFVVTGVINPGYVTIADGMYHKLASPKKKNARHLKPYDGELPGIGAKLIEGKKIFEAELSGALKRLEQNQMTDDK
ncbi:MAG: KOW domain-containing RNA-binding protein [Firmicutes bacterium]|nr:KOW domain-containing RNA-binding protein [Bacillota bacterium]